MRRKIHKKPGVITPKKRTHKLYPIIFCSHENIAIGLSFKPMAMKGDRFGRLGPKYKVNKKHWLPEFCKFRSEKYIIDLREAKAGEKVYCSKCHRAVDFRLFPSATKPEMISIEDVKKDNTQKLSDS